MTRKRSMAVRRSRVRSSTNGPLSVVMVIALAVSLVPMARIVTPTGWIPAALFLIVTVFLCGYLIRRFAGASAIALIVQVGFVAAFLTAAFSSGWGLFGVIPTPTSVQSLVAALNQGVSDMRNGVAPMPSSMGVNALLVSAIGALSVVLDYVVGRWRLALIGALVTCAIALAPGLILPEPRDLGIAIALFVLMVAMLLFATPAPAKTFPTRAALGASLATGAVVVALVVAPLIPSPGTSNGRLPGLGVARSLDASLDLGRDLRRPGDAPVLSYRSDENTAPYLRLATMSEFNGGRWVPDDAGSANLEALSTPDTARTPGVEVTSHQAQISTDDVSSYMLPLPANATEVSGVEGAWHVRPGNRAVFSDSHDATNLDYGVAYDSVRPTRDQLRAATTTGAGLPDSTRVLPDTLSPIVNELMQEVTANETSAFDKLMALQSWFRSSEFDYSLDAPIDNNYDGTGVGAIASFLELRAGYCVHFATTYTVMARELGLSARVVLGFLPGTATGEKIDGETVFEVTSTQLHTWPEVWFDGIGWVAFEPTASLGTPAAFRSGDSSGGAAPSAAPSAEATTAAPGASPSPTRTARDSDAGGAAGSASGGGTDLRVPLIALGVLLLLSAPAIIRRILRGRRLRAASAGDPLAAWRELLALATDLGLPVSQSGSVRANVSALHGLGVDLTAVRDAVERESYAGTISPQAAETNTRRSARSNAPEWVSAIRESGTLWPRTRPGVARVRAVIAPRSLWRRPAQPRGATPEEREYAPAERRPWSKAPTDTR